MPPATENLCLAGEEDPLAPTVDNESESQKRAPLVAAESVISI